MQLVIMNNGWTGGGWPTSKSVKESWGMIQKLSKLSKV